MQCLPRRPVPEPAQTTYHGYRPTIAHKMYTPEFFHSLKMPTADKNRLLQELGLFVDIPAMPAPTITTKDMDESEDPVMKTVNVQPMMPVAPDVPQEKVPAAPEIPQAKVPAAPEIPQANVPAAPTITARVQPALPIVNAKPQFQCPDMEDWTVKFAPKSLSEISINPVPRDQVRTVLSRCKSTSGPVPEKYILLLSGPVGSGKSLVTQLACREHKMQLIDFDFQADQADLVGAFLRLAIRSYAESAIQLIPNANAKATMPAILLDHIDCQEAPALTGILACLIDGMQKHRHELARKLSLDVKDVRICPIICICNDKNSPRVKSLLNLPSVVHITFKAPYVQQLRAIAQSVLKQNKQIPSMFWSQNQAEISEMLQSANGDVRSMLIRLQEFVRISSALDKKEYIRWKKEKKVNIDDSDLEGNPLQTVKQLLYTHHPVTATAKTRKSVGTWLYELPLSGDMDFMSSLLFENYPVMYEKLDQTTKFKDPASLAYSEQKAKISEGFADLDMLPIDKMDMAVESHEWLQAACTLLPFWVYGPRLPLERHNKLYTGSGAGNLVMPGSLTTRRKAKDPQLALSKSINQLKETAASLSIMERIDMASYLPLSQPPATDKVISISKKRKRNTKLNSA